jgi:hypothetical protein
MFAAFLFSVALAGEPATAPVAAPVTEAAYPAPTSAPAPVSAATAVSAPVYAPIVNFAGKVLERGTRRPVPDAQVVVADLGLTAFTDKDGVFAFEDVPAGKYDVVVPVVGYQRYKTSETLSETERTDVVYYIEPDFGSPLEVVVEADKVKKEVSKTTIQRAEIKKIPGTGGDAIKAITALPGVATSSELGSDLIVRGSGPFDNTLEIDRIEVPYIFHFGGLRSVLNSDLIDTIDFQAGGFSANFGRATGGVLLTNTRPGRRDRFGGTADVNVAMAEGYVEGPFAGGKGSYAVAARRSYFDLIVAPVVKSAADPEDFQVTIFPQFYDYQARVDYEAVTGTTVKAFALGADDILALAVRPNPREPDVNGFGIHQRFHVLGTGVKLVRGDYVNQTQLYYETRGTTIEIGRAGNKLDIQLGTPGLTSDASRRFGKRNVLNFGVQGAYDYLTFNSKFPQPPKQGQTDFTFSDAALVTLKQKFTLVRWGAYVDDQIYVTEKWMLDPGVRGDYYFQDDKAYTYLDPRLLSRLELTKRFTLKAAVGRYSDFPTEQQLSKDYGNPDLAPIRSTHYVGGVEYKLTESDALDVQTYYKWIDGLVFSYPTGLPYRNSVVGEAYGVEIFLRHYMTKRFFGWVSYAYARSFRKYPDDGKWVPAGFDQPHIVNAVASYKLTNRWETGLKWRYNSGNPYTPYTGSIYVADKSIYFPITGERNSKRLTAQHRLDARIEYARPYDTWTMRYYLEVLNVYAAKNPADYADNYDYSQRTAFYIIPVPVPLLGVRAEF